MNRVINTLLIYSDNPKTMEQEDTFYQYLTVFDVKKKMVLQDNNQITDLVKWVCLHCTTTINGTF